MCSISTASPHTCFSRKQGLAGTQNETHANSGKAIRINCIVPGFIGTRLPDSFNLKSKQEIYFKNKKEETKKPEQIAELVMWLSSEKTSFSTGACFPEYAGYVAN